MSLVRMCDKCGEVFSEKLEGWQTFTVTKTTTNAYGQRVAIPEDFDACPSCSFTGTVQPVIRDDAPKEIQTAPKRSGFTPDGIHINRSDVCGYCEVPGHSSKNCPERKRDDMEQTKDRDGFLRIAPQTD